MSLNKFSIIGYILFIISIIIFFYPKHENVKKIVRIQREIHQIQTIRKEQTRETDSKIDIIRKEASRRISNIKELDFNTEIKPDGGDSVRVVRSQLDKCLEYKIAAERDSASLLLMTADRDSCNSQLDTIVAKVDTIVVESKKETDSGYRKGLLHGIISGIVVAIIGSVVVIFAN